MGIKSGAVGFSIKFIQIVLPHILSVLPNLFNFIITSSSFPTAWKTAIVLPFRKLGVPTTLVDFPPISILPVLLKGIKRILWDQFVEYIESCVFFFMFLSWF
jgi:hypothetical protein